jgi:hypothetical protein
MAQRRVSKTATRSREAAAAFRRVEPELEALRSAGKLAVMNVNLERYVTLALEGAPRVARFRGQIAAEMPRFDLGFIDRLPDYILATHHLALQHRARRVARPAPALLAEANAVRTRLLTWSVPLVESGMMSRPKRARGRGDGRIAVDLAHLVVAYRAAWKTIEGRCAITEDYLDHADSLHTELSSAQLSVRQSIKPPWLLRAALTLLDRAYSQCRRALQYLRYEQGDVDEILPNPRRNRGLRGRARSNR